VGDTIFTFPELISDEKHLPFVDWSGKKEDTASEAGQARQATGRSGTAWGWRIQGVL